uniref:Uncharacterized protein n=1 Tax=Arundo donax TaxID=35708 RepID=A0A0A8YLG8_ARUDO
MQLFILRTTTWRICASCYGNYARPSHQEGINNHCTSSFSDALLLLEAHVQVPVTGPRSTFL